MFPLVSFHCVLGSVDFLFLLLIAAYTLHLTFMNLTFTRWNTKTGCSDDRRDTDLGTFPLLLELLESKDDNSNWKQAIIF